MFTPRPLLILTSCLILYWSASASAEPTLEQRLEKLEQTLDAARQDAHVPGMSIAIVKDDEIIWMRGFGFSDVGAQKPADENTIYAVGSTTKAFTATLVGMLVDEGKANWDDPVTKHLPYFDLQVRSNDENAECTMRDLLSHRHGFARMGVLMIGGKASRDEILRTAAGAEPLDDFRNGFLYCNVTYLAAGQAAGVAGGDSWDDMMVDRLFQPLNMTSSTVSLTNAKKDPRLALGYMWDETLEQNKHLEMIDLDPIAPAGAVNSNVLDMAQWVRLQLGQGKINGKRLISADRIIDTWTPQIEMAPGASYGMGWMLHEVNGHKVVEHGGNIDGFSAEVALMPDQNLGYVLLMNSQDSPLREASIEIVFDALLDHWPEENNDQNDTMNKDALVEAEDINFNDYTGIYIANFAKFRDAPVEILIHEDDLTIDIAGQRQTALALPDAEGKWVSVLSDRLAVSFDRNSENDVVGLRIHTNGFRFEVPRKGHKIEPEVPAEELEKYVGTYIRENGGKRVEILIDRGHLTMDNRGTMLMFNTPNDEGHASLRAREDQGATFKIDADGKTESFVFHGNAGPQFFSRLVDSADAELPTLEQIHSLRNTDSRRAAFESDSGTKLSGEVLIAQAGLRGELTIYTRGTNRWSSHFDFAKFGRIDEAALQDQAWSFNPLRGFVEQEDDELAQAILAHPGAVEGDWSEYFDSVEVTGTDTVNDRPVYVVRLKKADLPSRIYRIDAETGDVLRMNQIAIEFWGPIPMTTTYRDFAEIDGIRRPMRVEIENPASGKTIFTFEKIESGLDLSDDIFTLQDIDPEG